MKTLLLVNPNAGMGRVKRRWHLISKELQNLFGVVEERFTRYKGEAQEITLNSLQDGYLRIIVVGGDGTLNEVVNGWLDSAGNPINPDAELVVYPSGTGSDFGRSLGLTGNNFIENVKESSLKSIDTARVEFISRNNSEVHHFINVASIGASGAIAKAINSHSSSLRILGGKGMYALGAFLGLISYRNQRLRVRIDDIFEEERIMTLVAVANGRYFGGGMKVAPSAVLNDGMLDVIVSRKLGGLEFLKYKKKIYRGEHLSLREFEMHQGKKISITPEESDKSSLLIETDGETPGIAPLTVIVQPKSLKIRANWALSEAII